MIERDAIVCPECGGRVVSKGKRFLAKLGRDVMRWWCPDHLYHLREVDTGEVIDLESAPRAQAAPAPSIVDQVLARLGISRDGLTFTTFRDGKPRVITQTIGDEDLDKLPQEEAQVLRALNLELLAVNAAITGLRKGVR